MTSEQMTGSYVQAAQHAIDSRAQILFVFYYYLPLACCICRAVRAGFKARSPSHFWLYLLLGCPIANAIKT